MVNSSALDTLIELATEASDEAARRLGSAIRAETEAAKKLDLLIQYRAEYTARYEVGLSKGISAVGYRNFIYFLEKLDYAIEGQSKLVEESAKKVGHERTLWQLNEKKRMSYDTLATRAAKQAQQEANRREQKLTDEIATRRQPKR